MDIEQIKQDIKRLGLDQRNRERIIVYQRFYLYAYLNRCGFTQLHISDIFAKAGHSSICHGIRTHFDLREDKYYQLCTAELQEKYQWATAGQKSSYGLVAIYKNDLNWIEDNFRGQRKADVMRTLIQNYESK